MITRTLTTKIVALAQKFQVITLTGPRQSGKTTLARAIFAGKPYVSMEDPDVRFAAIDDPRAFLERYPDGAVFDEVQRTPDLFSYLPHDINQEIDDGWPD